MHVGANDTVTITGDLNHTGLDCCANFPAVHCKTVHILLNFQFGNMQDAYRDTDLNDFTSCVIKLLERLVLSPQVKHALDPV